MRASYPRVSFALVAVMCLACDEAVVPPVARQVHTAELHEVADAARGGGNANFLFLPPMVSAVQTRGDFDAMLTPSVEICKWTNASCVGPLVATFTSTGGGVVLNASQSHYAANWNTAQYSVAPGEVYRITVRILGAELGHADIRMVENAGRAKNVTTGDEIVLVDGRTLPIRFRIERGATEAIIGASGGAATLANGGVRLDVPEGAVTEPIAFSATPTTVTDASVLATTAFDMRPSPMSFAQPVTLSLRYPAALPARIHPSRLTVCKMVGAACVEMPRVGVDEQSRMVSGLVSGFSDNGLQVFPELLYRGGPGGTWLHTPEGEISMPDGQYNNSWSPDGSMLLYESYDAPSRPDGIRVVNGDGSGDHAIPLPAGVTGQCPVWAPSGNKILFLLGGTMRGLGTVSPDGSNFQQVTDYHDQCGFKYSPDGQRIVWPRFADPLGTGLFVATSDGTAGPRLLVAADFNDGLTFAFSADGTQLAFVADSGGADGNVGRGIFVANSDGTNLRRLYGAGDAACVANEGLCSTFQGSKLSWSPVPGDNRVLLLTMDFYRVKWYLHVINVDRGEVKRLNPWSPDVVVCYADTPTWSPDATRIAFMWLGPACDSRDAVYLVSPDGSGLQRFLPHLENPPVHPYWRP